MKKLFILLSVSVIALASCKKETCQTCNLVHEDGSIEYAGDEYCGEQLTTADKNDCQESANLSNFYSGAQPGDSNYAFCDCVKTEK